MPNQSCLNQIGVRGMTHHFELAERISEMKPLSLFSLSVCVFVLLLSGTIFILRNSGLLEVHWVVLIFAGAAPCLTGGFLIYNYFKKPFIHEYRWSDWIKESEDRNDIYVFIPASIHKQGRRPIIEIQSIKSPYSTKLVEPLIADNGDVEIVHPEHHFTTDGPKEFGVRIVAG